MQKENICNIDEIIKNFARPVLVVSTVVGRGMYYIGEAIRIRFPDTSMVHHFAIENFLPPEAVNEDLKRYKLISNRFRFLLYIIYKFPFFYYRKYIREKFFSKSDLNNLKKEVERIKPKTIICVSHRAAFWVSSLKRREKMDFEIWDVLGEYGKNLGYKYLFWEEINGFLSPIDKDKLGIKFPDKTKFVKINLPARREFYEIAAAKGDCNKVILVCGFWGQGPIAKIIKLLIKEEPCLKIYAVCGENDKLCKSVKAMFYNVENVKVCGIAESLAPLMRECAAIITKPGISTILEAHAAQRKIFLLKGMPVAEDNNARYAIKNFDAEWFSIGLFKKWHRGVSGNL